MKPTITLITILIAVAVSGQTKDTIKTVTIGGSLYPHEMTKVYDTLPSTGSLVYTGSQLVNQLKGTLQYYNSQNKMVYSIKSDGTIELGNLIIDAVVKGLEKKGYRLIKVGGSVSEINNYIKFKN